MARAVKFGKRSIARDTTKAHTHAAVTEGMKGAPRPTKPAPLAPQAARRRVRKAKGPTPAM